MLDRRIYTFLTLCRLMNYRKTAEALNLTQPAVTGHIKYLENEYGCRLFEYNGRVLSKTQKCQELETYARSLVFNDKMFRKKMEKEPVKKIRIGATKTIGDYAIGEKVVELSKRKDLDLELLIDNTDNLLSDLNKMKLDLLLIEGIFDKNSYGYRLIKKEKFTGICSKVHRFAGKTVPLKSLFDEHIILREEGSGTRAVLEHFLDENGYSFHCFSKKTTISSIKLIEKTVERNVGISFVYESIPESNPLLATFQIEDGDIYHEFNYVYLKDTDIGKYLELLQ